VGRKTIYTYIYILCNRLGVQLRRRTQYIRVCLANSGTRPELINFIPGSHAKSYLNFFYFLFFKERTRHVTYIRGVPRRVDDETPSPTVAESKLNRMPIIPADSSRAYIPAAKITTIRKSSVRDVNYTGPEGVYAPLGLRTTVILRLNPESVWYTRTRTHK